MLDANFLLEIAVVLGFVGIVVMLTDANEKEAIAVAIKQFEIEPARRNRIVVTKIGVRDDD